MNEPKAEGGGLRRAITQAGWLALRHVQTHRGQALGLAVAWGLALFLPVAAWWGETLRGEALRRRAEHTPLVLGAAGARYDAVLNALYFQAPAVDPVAFDEVGAVAATGLADAVPIHARFGVRGHPVVGTDVGPYLGRRGLELAVGTAAPGLLEGVVGAELARTQGLSVGDRVLPDAGAMSERAAPRPQLLTVVGILRSAGTVDDTAMFVPTETTWALAGTAGTLTSVVVFPRDDAAATRLKAIIHQRPGVRMYSPAEVVNGLVGAVGLGRPAFAPDALALLSLLVVALALVAQVWLRRTEVEVLGRLGAGRGLVVGSLAIEGLLCMVGGLVLAALALGLILSGGLPQG